ncbi:hypothetical protein CFC21_094838 [Triticum aestivum]|uniref:Uncharacterized protein n=3 Tax=Triticinae TaxID=1648030 RepID=A0A3B6QPT5_WHEAT|nr:hypothetical protein CFC21_094838 [Triticum aestivum]
MRLNTTSLDRDQQGPVTATRIAMDSTVDAMAAAYDALVDAAAAHVREPGRAAAVEDLKRRLDAFHECCDRAEDLVHTAAARLGPANPRAAGDRLDALDRALHAVGAPRPGDGHREEKEKAVQEDQKDPAAPTSPVVPGADDK